MDLKSLLSKYFCDSYNIDLSKGYKVEKIKASELIVPERIDLIAKLKYIEHREKGYDMTFVKNVYVRHIEAFSCGTYKEPGNDDKTSIEKYFKTFDLLIDDIKDKGFSDDISIIPVGKNNVIIDGAHRTAIAAYFNLEIPIIRFDDFTINYNAEYFRNRLLEESYLDYLVTEYCKISNNIYFACIWPIAQENLKIEEMNDVLNQHCKVVYRKEVKINYNGLKNLITQIYSSQDWIGNLQNNFVGASAKADECFNTSECLMAYVLESESLAKILELKSNVRNIFHIGKHSIHITDNKEETNQLANLLLNENSIGFLNNGDPHKYKAFNERLKAYHSKIISNGFNVNEFIIVSSSTLALFGLRSANDIDFMAICKEFKTVEDSDISNHHAYIHFYETTIDNLIFNPNNYIVFNGLKFIALDVLRDFKMKRNEKKDRIDVKLMDSILGKQNRYILKLAKFKSWFQRKKRNFKYSIIKKNVEILRRVGLFDVVRKLYHKLRCVRGDT
jgi:hypothetical protein